MGIKHRYGICSIAYTEHPNGSRCFHTGDSFASVAKVERCPCEDGITRTAHATAEADTFFSIPACVYVGRKTVGGFLTCDDDGWRFVAAVTGKNAGLIRPVDVSS